MTIREINKSIQNLTDGEPTTIQVHAYVGDYSDNSIDVEIWLPEHNESYLVSTYEGIEEHEGEAIKEVKRIYKSMLKKYDNYDVKMLDYLLSC